MWLHFCHFISKLRYLNMYTCLYPLAHRKWSEYFNNYPSKLHAYLMLSYEFLATFPLPSSQLCFHSVGSPLSSRISSLLMCLRSLQKMALEIASLPSLPLMCWDMDSSMFLTLVWPSFCCCIHLDGRDIFLLSLSISCSASVTLKKYINDCMDYIYIYTYMKIHIYIYNIYM